jgi:hypothetical protein
MTYKNLVLSIFVVVLVSVAGSAQAGPIDPGSEGLVAYYALENDVNDSSGNGLDGVITTVGGVDPTATYVAGPKGYGTAIDLLPSGNGTQGSYVNCGADPNFDFVDAMTVGAWINVRSVPDEWRAIVCKGDNAWRISLNGATTAIQYSIAGYGTRPAFSVDGTTEVGFDSWHYVCGTYDTIEGAKLYIDGELEGTLADLTGISVNTFNVTIGANEGDTGWKPYRLFDGQIDEVRIYNRALPQDEIDLLVAPKYEAAPVPLEEVEIVNPSFELPGTTKQNAWDGGTNAKGTFEDVPGWSSDTMANDSGVESDSRYPATDGVWTGFLMAGDPSVWNLTSHLIADGDDFVLSVDARDNYTATPPALLTMSLYCGIAGTRLAMATTTVEVTGEMATYTLSLPADVVGAAAGLPIGIELKNSSAGSSWIGIDNVHLTVD